MKTCETCRFWRNAPDLSPVIAWDNPGQCCIRAPSRPWRYDARNGGTLEVTFPITTAVEFCGEHSPKGNDND